ncbi:SUMF1/EgtB/PvdO family nonheme iron enzyme [bacterium]|nr:SUMF1/EgtB/PvdO family nonheme iron enzyme [bacterium]
MMIPRLMGILALACLPFAALAADPVVSNVSYTVTGQANLRRVDITFTLADADGDSCWLDLWTHAPNADGYGTNPASSLTWYEISTLGVPGRSWTNKRFAPGTYRLTWLASADIPYVFSRSDIQLYVRASDTGRIAPGRYMGISVASGPSSTGYPVTYSETKPFPNSWELVLRELPDGSWMGAYEVTAEEYARVTGELPGTSGSYPATGISWDELTNGGDYGAGFFQRLRAKTGIAALSLPSEAAWEYACRAGGTGEFADFTVNATMGGAAPPSTSALCWSLDNSSSGPSTVGRKRPNAWGLYDMHGNVWEFTDSPTIAKGGSWNSPFQWCGASERRAILRDATSDEVGFRLYIPAGASLPGTKSSEVPPSGEEKGGEDHAE